MTKFQIKNSVAFVTGTNKKRGIGRSIVQALIQEGAKKVYATARDVAQLEDLVAQYDGKVIAVSLDVTDKLRIKTLGTDFPDVNLIVNNAGYGSPNTSLDDPELAEKEMAINYLAPLSIVRSFARPDAYQCQGPRRRREARATAVVNIASISSFVNFPPVGTYSASKAAAHSLTQAQRRDLPTSLVVGVYPGPIDTDMADMLDLEKESTTVVAAAVVAALNNGVEEVFPDATAKHMYQAWKTDAKSLEQSLAKPQPVSA
jgi:NAD(P)-dependent dehydrogenase (short-subunit alcohol dehydrogenase family)